MKKILFTLLSLFFVINNIDAANLRRIKKRSPGVGDFGNHLPNYQSKTNLNEVYGLNKDIEVINRLPETLIRTFISNNHFLPYDLEKDLQADEIRGSPYGTAKISVKGNHEKYQGSVTIHFRVPHDELRRKRKS